MVVRCCLIQGAVCPYKVLLWRGRGILIMVHALTCNLHVPGHRTSPSGSAPPSAWVPQLFFRPIQQAGGGGGGGGGGLSAFGQFNQ